MDDDRENVSWVAKTRFSLSRLDWRLYLALVITAVLPTIYTSTRIHFLGDLPNEAGVNIASQLAWINAGLEVVQEAVIFPLYYLLGKSLSDRFSTLNKIKTGLIVTFSIYALLAAIIAIFVQPLLVLMAHNTSYTPEAADYIRLELIAITVFNAVRFLTVFLVLMNWQSALYTALGIQVFVSIVMDTLLLSSFDFSLRLGVNGIAYSNIAASFVVLCYLLRSIQQRYAVTRAEIIRTYDFSWLQEWLNVGKWSAVDSLIRNVVFIVVILRMMNVIEEQGSFWVVNSFIWGWLLVLFLPLTELIKQDTARGYCLPHWDKMLGYYAICCLIAVLWLVFSGNFEWIFRHVFNVEPERHVELTLILLPFYMCFMINRVMDSVLYGHGKTKYLALQSLITNGMVYGSAYLLFVYGYILPDLKTMTLLFGAGIVVDSFVTGWLYLYHLRLRGYQV